MNKTIFRGCMLTGVMAMLLGSSSLAWGETQAGDASVTPQPQGVYFHSQITLKPTEAGSNLSEVTGHARLQFILQPRADVQILRCRDARITSMRMDNGQALTPPEASKLQSWHNWREPYSVAGIEKRKLRRQTQIKTELNRQPFVSLPVPEISQASHLEIRGDMEVVYATGEPRLVTIEPLSAHSGKRLAIDGVPGLFVMVTLQKDPISLHESYRVQVPAVEQHHLRSISFHDKDGKRLNFTATPDMNRQNTAEPVMTYFFNNQTGSCHSIQLEVFPAVTAVRVPFVIEKLKLRWEGKLKLHEVHRSRERPKSAPAPELKLKTTPPVGNLENMAHVDKPASRDL